jgi:hypothetical protein
MYGTDIWSKVIHWEIVIVSVPSGVYCYFVFHYAKRLWGESVGINDIVDLISKKSLCRSVNLQSAFISIGHMEEARYI